MEDLILGIETVFDNPRLIIMWIISFSLLYFGFPIVVYLISISSSALLLKIILSRKYKEEHAFGSWLSGGFILLILFQEFYVPVS